MTPSAILTRAADLIRDRAADTTKPRPGGHGWSLLGEDDGWEPDWATVVSCAGYGGEDVIATDIRVGDARWIALLSPAVSPMIESWLRETASYFDEFGEYWVTVPEQARNALDFAKTVLKG